MVVPFPTWPGVRKESTESSVNQETILYPCAYLPFSSKLLGLPSRVWWLYMQPL